MIEPMFTTTVDKKSAEYARFVFEPLNTSFGNSIGNALRRTLLSSLPGLAVSYVRFDQAPHFFTTISGVKESTLDIVLNMKQIRFTQGASHGPFRMKLSAKGVGKIFAKDFEGEVEVVNGDLYIAELTDAKAKLDIEIIVEVGYGYQASEDKVDETGFIPVDSSYSPVTKVNFKVEEARVGRKSDYERLILEVWTDGSTSPKDAVLEASTILSRHFGLIAEGKEARVQEEGTEEKPQDDASQPKAYDTIIDELNLPSRVINALLRENIETVADLVKRGKEDLTNLKGVGKKSIDLIVDELAKMNVVLE